MENQLSSLISDTVKRPIIINGKLVTSGNQVVYLKRGQNYGINYIVHGPNRQETLIPNGDELLDSVSKEFNDKYGSLVNNSDNYLVNFQPATDSFTQAIVLRNGLYDFLVDEYDNYHLHDGVKQFQSGVRETITEFVKDSIINYFEIFLVLMNRKLMGGHMPVIIKSHLVAGLYQPLVLQTRHILAPIKFGEFRWFLDYLNGSNPVEEYLERSFDTNRGLDLSAVSIYDLHTKFGTRLIRELNRVHWMFILYIILMRFISPSGVEEMSTKYAKIYRAIEEGNGVAPGTDAFFYEFMQGIRKVQSSLMIVN